MLHGDITRRRVLQGVAAGLAGTTLAGEVSASNTGHVVGIEPGASPDIAKREATSVKHVLDWGDIGTAVAGQFPDDALEGLRQHPNVRYVERDIVGEPLGETLPWGVDRIDGDVAHANGETGGDNTDGEGGAHVAVIDTGIDSDHPDLDDNLGVGNSIVDCVPLSSRGGCPFGVGSNDNACNTTWDDDYDHGSHVAGTADAEDNSRDVIGVSTNATLHAVKVCDYCGSCSQSDTAKGLQWTADQGYEAANVSLGYSEQTQTLQDAVQYAYDNGVFIAAAAGNDGPCTDCVSYPAKYAEVVAVSATSKDDTLADFSSTGPEIELAAPGENIVSTTPEGTETFDGTSMASPHVAGSAAQLMDNGYTNTEARDQLNSTAEDIGLGSNEQGNGLVDVAAALGLDSSDDLGGGDSNSAPAVDSLSAAEVETSDSDAEFDVDWSVSDADGNLDTVDLTLTDDTDGETEDTASISVSGDTASGTTRLVAPGDDGSGNSYTVDCTVTDTDGATGSDSTTVTESEDTSGDNAPTIESWSISTRTTGPWFRVSSDWSVADTDGDLDTVTTELLDSSGNVLDSESSSVSGSSDSGSHEVRTRSSASDVRLTVTDANGNSTSDTKSV